MAATSSPCGFTRAMLRLGEGRRLTSSAIIAVFIVACILLLPQRAGSHSGEARDA